MKLLTSDYHLSTNKGSTLIEILLVLAIIGVLSGTIIISISGQREKARRAKAMESVRSVSGYLTECFMRGEEIEEWTNSESGGGKVCNSMPDSIEWPTLANTDCEYNGGVDHGQLVIKCDSEVGNIICNFGNTGECSYQDTE